MQPNRISSFRILLAITGIAFASLADAQGPTRGLSKAMQQVWSTKLGQLVREPPGWMKVGHHETGAVAFSPDNKVIAVTLAHGFRVAGSSEHDNTHLLLIDVQSPEASVRQFDLPGTCGVDLAWNQDGGALLVCGTLLRLADGAVCLVSSHAGPARYFRVNTGFWLDPEHVIRWSGTILDLACKEVGTWQLELHWRISAVAPSKGWIVVSHYEPGPKTVCEFGILDRASRQPFAGWERPKSLCGVNPIFALGTGALCNNLAGGDKQSLHCWAVNGAKEISIPKQLRDYRLNQAAASSTFVVADQWRYDRFDWLGLSPPLPRRRVVLDLRSGKELSSWKPRLQNSTSPSVEDWPYHCAVTSGGEYLAESGDAELDLYRIIQ
jgi:hypothetical protein